MEYYDQNYVNEDDEDDDEDDEGDNPYDSSQFYTEQVFNSCEELTNWVKTTGLSLGYVLVTKRTNKNAAGYVFKVVLACDRGGVYKGLGVMSSRSTGTKKRDCPFELEGYFREYDGWRVYVKNHKHNHHPASHLEGHSYARRMSEAEKHSVETLARLNLPARNILANLKHEFPDNVSTIKDIYNALQAIKEKAAEQIGSTSMQVVLSLLQTKNYIFEYTTDDISNRMENLFFVHPQSFEIWRAFPHVLIIDATYKTNIYNMSFVEIVGVTSTSRTFLVACAFIINEQEVTYRWVLECFKRILGESMKVSAIVTDRERALMNACRDVLPDAGRLLCRFHIRQNINKHCEPSFRSQHSWGQFIQRWNVVLNSCTHQMNLLIGAIDDIVSSQITAIKHSFENNKINRKHEHNLPCFRLLHGLVSKHALDMLTAELKRLNNIQDNLSRCGHRLLTSCGLPCACQLSVYIKSGHSIPLDSVNDYWRKLDFSPSTNVLEDDISAEEDDYISIDEEIDNFKETLKKQSKPVRRSWLRKIKDILNPGKTDVKAPAVQIQTRGRPSIKNKHGKIKPDMNKAPMFKKPSKLEKSRSMHTYGFDCSSQNSRYGDPIRDNVSESARHSSYVHTQSGY